MADKEIESGNKVRDIHVGLKGTHTWTGERERQFGTEKGIVTIGETGVEVDRSPTSVTRTVFVDGEVTQKTKIQLKPAIQGKMNI